MQYTEVLATRNWGPTGTTPPPDAPPCGFYGEKCPTTLGTALGIPLGLVGGGVLFAICAVFIYK